MKTIFKFPVKETCMIDLPHGWSFVSFGYDPESELCVWIEGDFTKPGTPEQFGLVGTGWEFSDDCVALGSVRDGDYMWHLICKVQY